MIVLQSLCVFVEPKKERPVAEMYVCSRSHGSPLGIQNVVQVKAEAVDD